MKNATKMLVSVFGTIMALAGVEHGVGEILQGNIVPTNIMILSWPDSAFFRSVGGEPAMTIIPNMQITGILAVIISIVMLVWVLFFVSKKFGSLMMILISIALLLSGGGIFPPLILFLIAFVSFGINSQFTGWRSHLSIGSRKTLAKLWKWFLGIDIFAWLAMLLGLGTLDYFLSVNNSTIIWIFLGCSIAFFFLTVLTGFAHDSVRVEEALGS